MDSVARLPVQDRAELFTETAARTNLSAIVVEKDFWVVWSLRRLYAVTGMPRLLFKGGTSLSKCFEIIERFSEDIDIGLHRDDLGLGGEGAPAPSMGSSSLRKARKRLEVGTQTFVDERLFPSLRRDFSSAITEPFELQPDHSGGECILNFQYPCALQSGEYGGGGYIRPIVKIELGARSDHHPTRAVEVRSLAAAQFIELFTQPGTEVVAQAPERTLLEKALILHSNAARNKVGKRSSRHAYDLAMMHRAGIMESVTWKLLEEVAQHKRVFGDDKFAGEAPRQGLRMVPDEAGLRELEADYRSMEEMFYSQPPSFAEIVEALRALEREITLLGPQSTA